MSRRYCSVCGVAHNNKDEGMCDQHLLEQDQNERDTHNSRADAYERFMALSDENRWEKVFNLLYEKDLL